MSSNFEQDYERVIRLAENPDTDYENIEAAMRSLGRYREPEQLQKVRELNDRIRDTRRENFEDLLTEVRGLIADGRLQTRATFDEYAMRLTRRARPNQVRTEIEDLRQEWSAKGQLDGIRQKVYFWIDKFRDAVYKDGMNPQRAGDEYLDKAQEVLNQAKAQMRDSSQVDELFADVNEVMREVDKRPLHTLATQQKYQEILTSLNRKKDLARARDGNRKNIYGDEEDVYDVNGILIARMSLNEAIEKYAELARDHARQKANEYLAEARRQLARGLPYSAELRINAIYTLYLLPPDSRQEAENFYATEISPILSRINNARENLRAVMGAIELETALEYYRAALDPITGWPNFRTLAESQQGEQASEAFDDFSMARDHLREGIENEIKSKLVLMEASTPVWLPQILSTEEFTRLEQYLRFENGMLKNVYAVKVAELKSAYERQVTNDEALRTLHHTVEDLVDRGMYDAAYQRLAKYREFLDTFPDIFPEIGRLWELINVFRNGVQIFQELQSRVAVGVTGKSFADQVKEVNALLAKGEQAQHTIVLQDVSNSEWENRLRALRDLKSLLEGEVLMQARKISEAVHMWKSVSDYIPAYGERARQRIGDAEARIQTDRELLYAIQRAEAYLEANAARDAYDVLVIHESKYDAEGYERLEVLLRSARQVLCKQLVQRINDNIAQNPADPAELIQLSDEFAQIDPQARKEMDTEIEGSLNIQTANRDFNDANTGQQPAKWRRALISYQAVKNPDHDRLFFIRVSYTISIVRETLILVEQEESYERTIARLDRVLSDITDLAQDPRGEPIARGLRYLVYVRQAELSDSPQKVRDRIGRAAAEIRMWLPREDDYIILNEMVVEYQQRQKDILELAQIAETVRSELTLEAPLSTWITARGRWMSAVRQIGVRVWLEIWVANLFEEISQRLTIIIQEQTQLWAKLDPMARQLILLGVTPSEDLNQYMSNLEWVTSRFTSDATIIRTTPFSKQIEQLQALKNASVAIFYLCEQRILLTALDPNGSNIATSIGRAAFEAFQQQTNALEVINEVNRRLKQVRDLLDSIRTTGQFDQVRDEMNVFQMPSAHLYKYREHPDVQELVNLTQEYQKEYEGFRGIADEVERAIDYEQFERALELLVQLETPEAMAFGTMTMVQFDDKFINRQWTNLRQVRLALENKRAEIKKLTDRLEMIVDVVRLLSIIAELKQENLNDETYSLKIDYPLRVGAYDDTRIEVIDKVCLGDFDSALELLLMVYDGNVGENEAPTYFRPNVFSLKQAELILTKFLADFNYNALSSMTARLIYRWANQTTERLQVDIDRLKDIYGEVRTRFERFQSATAQFMRAYNALKQPLLRRSEREEYLRQMRDSYSTIRANGQRADFKLETDVPIAPCYIGLDGRYQEWANEIRNKLRDDSKGA